MSLTICRDDKYINVNFLFSFPDFWVRRIEQVRHFQHRSPLHVRAYLPVDSQLLLHMTSAL